MNVEIVSHFAKIKSNALDHFSYLNSKQFNTITNRINSILDLTLFNSTDADVSRELSILFPIDNFII